MTDLQYALPLMKENVDSNNLNDAISCKECDWFNPPALANLFSTSDDPDIILVADCVWLSPLVAPLLETLRAYTANGATKVIITYQQRVSDMYDDVLQYRLYKTASNDSRQYSV